MLTKTAAISEMLPIGNWKGKVAKGPFAYVVRLTVFDATATAPMIALIDPLPLIGDSGPLPFRIG